MSRMFIFVIPNLERISWKLNVWLYSEHKLWWCFVLYMSLSTIVGKLLFYPNMNMIYERPLSWPFLQWYGLVILYLVLCRSLFVFCHIYTEKAIFKQKRPSTLTQANISNLSVKSCLMSGLVKAWKSMKHTCHSSFTWPCHGLKMF